MSENVETQETFLSVEHLTKDFGGAVVLDNVSFSFGKKGIHGILAPKASGKTALMEVLSCSSGFDSGSIKIGDKVYSPSAKYEKIAKTAKKKIGYVRKNSVFYPNMTVTEAMEFVGEARRVESSKLVRQIKEALDLTGLDKISKRLVKNLSTYELKLLDIASALLGNPDVILINELRLSELGFQNGRAELFDIIKMLGKMKTVVIATEDFSIARELCEDVVILSDGRVLASGSFSELESKLSGQNETLEGLYRALRKASSQEKTKNTLFDGGEK